MEPAYLPYTYLVPATSASLHQALTALGLAYEALPASPPPGATLLPLTV